MRVDLELKQYASVDLASSQVVGDGVLLVGNIGNPIIWIDVIDTKKIQAVHT